MVILGSGAVAYFLKRFYGHSVTIIDENKDYVATPPLFHIHKTEDVVMFLKHLNIPFEIKKIKVGFYDEGEYIDSCLKLTNEQKTRYKKKVLKNATSRFMNNCKDEYEVIEVDINGYKFDNAIVKRIVKIDRFNKTFFIYFDDATMIETEEILSTIPFPRLMSLFHGNFFSTCFRTAHKFYFEVDKDLLNGFDYIYDVGNSPFNRYIKMKNKIYGEVTSKEKLTNWDYALLDSQILNPLKGLYSYNGVMLYGRYAQWDNSILVHNVIERIVNE